MKAILAGVADDDIPNLMDAEWATLEEDCNKILHASSMESFEDAWACSRYIALNILPSWTI